jgi:hypothetical protein
VEGDTGVVDAEGERSVFRTGRAERKAA